MGGGGRSKAFAGDLARGKFSDGAGKGQVEALAAAPANATLFVFTDAPEIEEYARKTLDNNRLRLALSDVPTIHLDKTTAAAAVKYGYKTFVHFDIMTRCSTLSTSSGYGQVADAVRPPKPIP